MTPTRRPVLTGLVLSVDALAVLAALLLTAMAWEGERGGDPWAGLGYLLAIAVGVPALVSLLLLAARRTMVGTGADMVLALAGVAMLPLAWLASLFVVG